MNNFERLKGNNDEIWDMSDVRFAGEEYGLNEINENRSAETMREHTIDMATAQEGVLASNFESGVYLFHSTTVEGIEGIFQSGEILNAGEIYERALAAKKADLIATGKSEEEAEEELKNVMIRHNSGQEGISWSANGIDAMPGTRGRIAGFVAAPEAVLGEDKLVVPSRPALFELLQVPNNTNAKELYEAKKQHEVWGYNSVTVGETATVDSGLMHFRINMEYGDKPDEFGFYSSQLKNFCDRGGLSADVLREHFENTEDGHVKIDEDLYQQRFDEDYIPPAAVFVQAMIDRGEFDDLALKEKEVVGVFNLCKKNSELLAFILDRARQEGKRYADNYETRLGRTGKVSAKVEDMYFVTSHRDLNGWLDVMEKTGHFPRGILLYDDEKVVKENFASAERGDCDELSEEIGRIVGIDRGFWSNRMGLNVENIVRAGTRGQVLKDSEVNRDKEIVVENGKLEIVNT